MRLLKYMLGIIFFFLTTQTWAVGVGQIQVQSILNQPLQAQIRLTDAKSIPLSKIQVSIATQEQFEELGLQRSPFIEHLNVKVVEGVNQSPLILLSSDQPMNEPVMELLLQIQTDGESILKPITVMLDQSLPPISEQAEENETLQNPLDLIGVYYPPHFFNSAHALPVGQEKIAFHAWIAKDETQPVTQELIVIPTQSTPIVSTQFSFPAIWTEKPNGLLLFLYFAVLGLLYKIYVKREPLPPSVNVVFQQLRQFFLKFNSSHSSGKTEKAEEPITAQSLSNKKNISSGTNAEQLDALDAAEVYLNYARPQDAIKTLKQAYQKFPQRLDVLIKLLEVCAHQQAKVDFEEIYAQLPSDFAENQPVLWQKIQSLREGKEIINASPLVPSFEIKEDVLSTQFYLAQSFLELGGDEEAKELLETLVRSTDLQIATQATQLLETLNKKIK